MPTWKAVSLLVLVLLVIAPYAGAADEQIGPDHYPVGINPLTGLPVDNPQTLERRPLIVKISNYPPEIRPQSGLNQADIVWEHLLAGGVTRFDAVFLSRDVAPVGPIRSARLLDFQLLRIYEGLLVYSGMAQGTLDRLNTDSLALRRVLGGIGPCPALCRHPREGLALEHTLFGDTGALRALAATEGRDVDPAPLSGMTFQAQRPAGLVPVQAVNVDYRQTTISWQYDAASSRWLRFQDGEPHLDALDGRQISADNVLVLEADHIEQPETRPGYWGPVDFAFDVELTGSGRVFLLRDGGYTEGEWRRADESSALYFYDNAGAPLPLKPGNTFVNLVPRWVNGYDLIFRLEAPLTATIAVEGGVNLRLGPSTAYDAPDVGYPGDTFQAVGRSRTGDWVQLLRRNGDVVWVAADLVRLDGDPMRLPVPLPTIES